jgi:hypothetical protein
MKLLPSSPLLEGFLPWQTSCGCGRNGNVSRWRCDLILKLNCLQVKLLEPISGQVVRSRLRSWTSPWQDDSFSFAIVIGRRWIFCYDCVVRVSSAPLLSLFIEVHISSQTWYSRESFVLQQCCGLFWWLHQSITLLGLILHRSVRIFGVPILIALRCSRTGMATCLERSQLGRSLQKK